ncbi:PAS domain S-box protein [Acetonema longum]|uniref:Transcriptional regulator n=1 Tax=Acetonema longum DSM 6540 TaxID=1009370 RepID=F7NER3_9FIRM|nr:PAS domain S-box protein [Acetonema longum]EGO65474.1 transcriptional regulator [Acetonema longum DSM 6540]
MLDLDAIMETIIDSAVEGIAIVDTQGIIVFLNKAYENILGVKKEDAIGRHVTEVIDFTRLHIVIKTGIPEIGEIQQIRGKNTIVQRLPIIKNGQIIAGVGKVIFKNEEEVQDIIHKLETKVKYLESELNNLFAAKYSAVKLAISRGGHQSWRGSYEQDFFHTGEFVKKNS